MGKVTIEEVELNIQEKASVQEGEHTFKDDTYVQKTVTVQEFKSSVFRYPNSSESILVSKINLFNEDYFKIVFFCESISKAWTLLEIHSSLDIQLKRLNKTMFLIVANNPSKENKNVSSQISFCRIKPSQRVEEITINFGVLNKLTVLDSHIVLSYRDFKDNGVIEDIVAVYNYDGRLMQTESLDSA